MLESGLQKSDADAAQKELDALKERGVYRVCETTRILQTRHFVMGFVIISEIENEKQLHTDCSVIVMPVKRAQT